jgi:hypothetical protein
MTKYVVIALVTVVTCTGIYADTGEHGEEPGAGEEHAFLHPFLAHMGLPDGPGEVSMRVTPILHAMTVR